MARPFTRAQRLENAAFVEALRRTGNVRLAARETGLKYGTIQHRRRRHPALAQACEAALAFAQARFAAAGPRGPEAGGGETGGAARRGDPHRTAGGEPVVVRRNDGRLQMRTAQPGKLTRACEQAFLAALSATANVRLSAAAAGASVAAFYRRRRKSPGFAREFGLALEAGYARLEMALLESAMPESFEDDHWRHNEAPAIPPLTANQALQLLYLHQKEVRLGGTPASLRRRRGESHAALSMRLSLMHEARIERDREAYRVAQAARLAEGDAPPPHAPPPPALPDLGQVTGWSRADPASAAHDAERALFGGWRIAQMRAKRGE